MRRSAVLPVTALLGVLALGACNIKSAIPGGQVVATVDGEEITRAELNAVLPNGPVGNNAKAIQSAALDHLIAQKLLAAEARRQRIDHSQDYLIASRRANDEILADLLTRKTVQELRTPYSQNVSAFVQANPTRFAQREILAVDQIRFSDSTIDDAKMRDLHTLDAVIALLNQKKIEYKRGNTAIDSIKLEPAAFRQLTNLPAGEPFIVHDGGLTLVSVIVGRQPAPVPPEKTNEAALQILREQAARDALNQQMKTLRSKANIQFENGFGPAPSASAPAHKP